uniref:Inositol polyphosphate-related phosphatase domain-containing protein n=1 Tax=Kalanchoe fedtschenkoi TaxID=63787 RepID=A0A7N1A022_KALFE
MKDDTERKPKLSWTKSLVRKWFNIKSKSKDFQAEYDLDYSGGDEGFSNRFSEREACRFRKSKRERKRNSDRLRRGESNPDAAYSQITNVDDYRIFVSTWNVAGKSPPSHLGLEDWLHTSPPADIYVLGFQEIVPLNAGNVLGTEDNGPARKWLSLIRKTLNTIPSDCSCTPSPIPGPVVELEADFEGSMRGSAAPYFHRRSFHSLSHSMRADCDMSMMQPRLDRRFSVCDRVISGYRNTDSSDDEYGPSDSPNTTHCSPMSDSRSTSLEHRETSSGNSRYCLVADKQMVGIFLTVWVRRDLRDDVRNLKVSCVGRGLMGYLGNKGSISISMKLHQTSFCFVCSHLTSGQREGDELRRNSDVLEILRKTKFPRVHGQGYEDSPQTILDHDRVIWLGDLNYRIALSYQCAKALLEMHNWRALLDKDQLRVERRQGRVFQGWKEGRIHFPPTYKYSFNSDQYAGDAAQRKEKRRTPAWCDRVLWYGGGLRQLSYVRGVSRFSDHRPVSSVFLVKVESANHDLIKKSMSYSSSRVEVEELLPYPRKYRKNQVFY